MSIVIKNITLNQKQTDIYIEDNRFTLIAPDLNIDADTVLEGSGQVILPSLMNGHNHAAMTLLRGYADDMELHAWLENYIWPLESKYSEDNIYIGAKLACLEMIRSGTTFFNDMYWYLQSTARAVQEMGLRALLSSVFIDFHNEQTAQEEQKNCVELFEQSSSFSSRIQFALGPHAIYTVSPKSLAWVKDFSERENLFIHLHVSETEEEVRDCVKRFGKRPIEFLHDLGLLSPRLIACHGIWLNEREMDLLAQHHVPVIHNPVSNMKLCSGNFPFQDLYDRDICIGLGTDGCSSNNNLDMFEEMKFAALNAKARSSNPNILPADYALAAATTNAAKIFGLNTGYIQEGYLADCILVDLDRPEMTPNYHLNSNLVYSASGCCVRTTICDGKILMLDRHIPGEKDILEQARETARRLVEM
ncbi:MAG: amidohydrolase [Desulfohalobiaceae bacterium]|nr:amidohydrolase [Desulfohalobiaceae bacterium]